MTGSDADERFMEQALRLAARGRTTTPPNPCVGCLVVNGAEVVGCGFHRRAGEAHAEPQALAEAGDRAQGATLYVTLEPCVHQGRTAPCVPEITSAGIQRAVIACEDPNPQIAGRGVRALEEEGIECQVGVLADQSRMLNRGFWVRMTEGRPWVCVKQAMSLDGGTALADGTSQWITGPKARTDVQWRRARSGAILSTAATVRRDDARLNVRLSAKDLDVDMVRQPLRVVADRRGELTADLALWKESGPCIVYTSEGHAERLRDSLPSQAEVRTAHEVEGGLDLGRMLKELAQRDEVNDVLVETGARFAGALLQEDRIDELAIYIAPRLMGAGAAPLAELPPATDLPDRLDWTLQDVETLDPDVCLSYCRNR